jgi:spore maturation protein CgeB
MYERMVLATAQDFRPTVLLAVGYCPIGTRTIRKLRNDGARCINFLTDDPWNPNLRGTWFFNALCEYDVIFTPRRSNIDDLSRLGCSHVEYLPFAYNPHQHFEDPRPRSDGPGTDVLFVGGADADRVPLLHALVDAGLNVTVYGAHWHHYPRKGLTIRGEGSMAQLRVASATAKFTLILVRRANRDGHVMRTFESAACKVCLLVEETEEHRRIFGDDNVAVRYFQNRRSMVVCAVELANAPHERERLRGALYQLIVVTGRHTYANRLASMIHSAASGTMELDKAFDAELQAATDDIPRS